MGRAPAAVLGDIIFSYLDYKENKKHRAHERLMDEAAADRAQQTFDIEYGGRPDYSRPAITEDRGGGLTEDNAAMNLPASAYHRTPGLAQQRVDISRGTLTLAQDEAKRKELIRGVAESPFTQEEYDEIEGRLTELDTGSNTKVRTALGPFLNYMLRNVNKGSKLEMVKGAHQTFSDPEQKKKIVGALNFAKVGNPQNEAQQGANERIDELINQIQTDRFIPLNFEKCWAVMQEEEADRTKTPTTAMAAYLQQNPYATPEEIAKYARSLKQPKGEKTHAPKYHYETDDEGNVSVYKDGKLIKGEGKGKGKTKKEIDIYDVAGKLWKLQYDDKGNRRERIDEGGVQALKDQLKDTEYEIVEQPGAAGKEPAKFPLLGFDIPLTGAEAEPSTYVLQKKGDPEVEEPEEEPEGEAKKPEVARVLRNKRTGETVYLDAEGNVIKRENAGTQPNL